MLLKQPNNKASNMDIGQLIDVFLKYALAPLVAIVWYVFKKQDSRIEQLEIRMNDSEKTLIELRTEFKFIREDIAEIKNLLVKLSDK